MKRRGFLGALGAAIAGATLDPERALWVPGARAFSIPREITPRIDVIATQYFDRLLGKSYFRYDTVRAAEVLGVHFEITGLIPSPPFASLGACLLTQNNRNEADVAVAVLAERLKVDRRRLRVLPSQTMSDRDGFIDGRYLMRGRA
jgi:hypothetical protein